MKLIASGTAGCSAAAADPLPGRHQTVPFFGAWQHDGEEIALLKRALEKSSHENLLISSNLCKEPMRSIRLNQRHRRSAREAGTRSNSMTSPFRLAPAETLRGFPRIGRTESAIWITWTALECETFSDAPQTGSMRPRHAPGSTVILGGSVFPCFRIC